MSNPNIYISEKNQIKIEKAIVKSNTLTIKKMDSINTDKKEENNLILINKHNRNLEDKELIENCLQTHFFLRILNKTAR